MNGSDANNATIIAPQRRQFGSSKQNEEETAPFDRGVKLKQRARAAESCRKYYNHYIQSSSPQAQATAPSQQQQQQQQNNNNEIRKPVLPYDYFHKEVDSRLVERLDDINVREEAFPLALEVGAGAEFVHDAIIDGCDDDLMLDDGDADAAYLGGRGGVRKLVQLDSCPGMLHRDDAFAKKKDVVVDDGETVILPVLVKHTSWQQIWMKSHFHFRMPRYTC